MQENFSYNSPQFSLFSPFSFPHRENGNMFSPFSPPFKGGKGKLKKGNTGNSSLTHQKGKAKAVFDAERKTVILDVATKLVEQGYSVIPVVYQSKKAMVYWERYQKQLPSHTELEQWFYSNLRNIGLVVGNGLVVVDFDRMDVFEYWYKDFVTQYGGTYMVKTRRGVHAYFHTELPAKNYHNDLLDVKAERGYVLIPPSVHPSGYEYTVLSDSPILRVKCIEDVLPAYFMPEPEKNAGFGGIGGIRVIERSDDPWEQAENELPSWDIQEIKSRVSILDLLPNAVPSSRDGRWYVVLCPFHDDQNPSFWIDTERGICECRTCNIKTMDVINLYARLNNLTNDEAIKSLGNGS